MKCRYAYCKNNFMVEKEDAIKEGASYYCKECYEEKETKKIIEKTYIDNFPKCTIQLLRKSIKDLIHKENNSAQYVLFVMNNIISEKKPIKSPFGLFNYCNDYRYKEKYKTQTTNSAFKNISDGLTDSKNINNEKIIFHYTPCKPKWGKIL